jgi:hypothetical protein
MARGTDTGTNKGWYGLSAIASALAGVGRYMFGRGKNNLASTPTSVPQPEPLAATQGESLKQAVNHARETEAMAAAGCLIPAEGGGFKRRNISNETLTPLFIGSDSIVINDGKMTIAGGEWSGGINPGNSIIDVKSVESHFPDQKVVVVRAQQMLDFQDLGPLQYGPELPYFLCYADAENAGDVAKYFSREAEHKAPPSPPADAPRGVNPDTGRFERILSDFDTRQRFEVASVGRNRFGSPNETHMMRIVGVGAGGAVCHTVDPRAVTIYENNAMVFDTPGGQYVANLGKHLGPAEIQDAKDQLHAALEACAAEAATEDKENVAPRKDLEEDREAAE